MDKFLKKKRKTTPTIRREPLIICSHNVNGFSKRITNDIDSYRQFLKEHNPDVVLLQEAKLKCEEGRQGNVHPGYSKGKVDKAQVEKYNALLKLFPKNFDSKEEVFKEYNATYSLSRDSNNKAYAGTICLYKKDLYRPMFRFWLDGEEERHDEHGRIIVV